jgi:hypothetical protein
MGLGNDLIAFKRLYQSGTGRNFDVFTVVFKI